MMIITDTIVFDQASPSLNVTSSENQFSNILSNSIFVIPLVVFSAADFRLAFLQYRCVEAVVSVAVTVAITVTDTVSIKVSVTVAVAVNVAVTVTIVVAVAIAITITVAITLPVSIINVTTTTTYDTTDLAVTMTV